MLRLDGHESLLFSITVLVSQVNNKEKQNTPKVQVRQRLPLSGGLLEEARIYQSGLRCRDQKPDLLCDTDNIQERKSASETPLEGLGERARGWASRNPVYDSARLTCQRSCLFFFFFLIVVKKKVHIYCYNHFKCAVQWC